MNTVCLMGRLCSDIELKRTQSGTAVCSFTLAVERGGKAQERQTDFIDCVAWQTTAEAMSKYLGKGRMVAVVGRIQTRNWEDRNGNKRKATEVVVERFYFADSRPDGTNARGTTGEPEFVEMDETGEDLPF